MNTSGKSVVVLLVLLLLIFVSCTDKPEKQDFSDAFSSEEELSEAISYIESSEASSCEESSEVASYEESSEAASYEESSEAASGESGTIEESEDKSNDFGEFIPAE